ncbi:MAG: hypothetical protein GY715_21460 [Planctomycetes bacterium]|nr:hypothetical protein [Planctomycetota bacterium]
MRGPARVRPDRRHPSPPPRHRLVNSIRDAIGADTYPAPWMLDIAVDRLLAHALGGPLGERAPRPRIASQRRIGPHEAARPPGRRTLRAS